MWISGRFANDIVHHSNEDMVRKIIKKTVAISFIYFSTEPFSDVRGRDFQVVLTR